MRRRATIAVLGLLTAALACGGGRTAGGPGRPEPGAAVPGLFDVVSIYRSMGFLVAGAPLRFVGAARYLAGAGRESTLVVFALSMANNALTFRRDGDEFVAQYHVELGFRNDAGLVRQVARDESVRVRSFQETMRADESVIFQQFLALAPGAYRLTVLLRDRNGPAFARQDQAVTVPSFAEQGLSTPIPFYEGSGRERRAELPRLLVNPRATLPFGGDSLQLYVEAYRAPRRAAVAARVIDATGGALWWDTLVLAGDADLARGVVLVEPGALPLGQVEVELELLGTGLRSRAPMLVSFSHQWVITNFDEVLSLLRYFDRVDWIGRLRNATPEERPALWREFWRQTDPQPMTPENEALDEYFRRVQLANIRYQEGGEAGWLTDRGEVYITLGEPDEELDLSSELARSGARIIRWTYNTHRLILFFQDQTGFGRFRLTPLSRAEYQRVMARVRQPR